MNQNEQFGLIAYANYSLWFFVLLECSQQSFLSNIFHFFFPEKEISVVAGDLSHRNPDGVRHRPNKTLVEDDKFVGNSK